MAEEWRVIPGFVNYEVSDQGRVRGLKSGVILRPTHNTSGYTIASLRKGGRSYRKSVHRLVLLAFIGPSDLDCNHKNGIRSDNRLDNLEYVTTQENIRHSIHVLKNRDQRGERNSHNLLTEQQVGEIRQLYAQGGRTYRSLAAMYGVSDSSIYNIVRRISWRHVK